MKNLLVLLCCGLFWHTLLAQSVYNFKDPSKGKWGVRDSEWNIVLAPEYDYIQPRPDTLIFVEKDGKKGFFAQNGQAITPLVYDQIVPQTPFYNRDVTYLKVTRDEKNANTWGVLNGRGQVVIPEKFQYIRVVAPNLLAGRQERDTILQFFNNKGKVLYQLPGIAAIPIGFLFGDSTFAVETKSGSTLYVNLDGTPIYPKNPAMGMWTDGNRVIVRKMNNHIAFQGLTDMSGRYIIPLQLGMIHPALPGQFLVENDGLLYEDLGKGIFDSNGKPIITSAKQEIEVWDGVYKVTNIEKDLAGLYDKNGAEILPQAYHFQNCWTPANLVNRAQAYPQQYVAAKEYDPKGVVLIKKDGTIRRFEGASNVQYIADNYPLIVQMAPASEHVNGHTKLVDLSGKEVLPAQYAGLQYTTDPKIWTGRLDYGKPEGFIDVDAPEKAEFKYTAVFQFQNGYLCAAWNNSKVDFDLFQPDYKLLLSGQFERLNAPRREDYEAFRTQYPDKTLVAQGKRNGLKEGEWLAIDHTGKEYIMQRVVEVTVSYVPKPTNTPSTSIPTEPGKVLEVIPEVTEKEQVEEIMSFAEQNPSFPGGETEMFKFLAENLKYPAIAVENGVAGRVVVNFIVEKDGSLSNLKIIRDIGGGCGQEALRLVQSMPKWEPAKNRGRAVRVQYTLPISFKLN